jgi:ABC transporter substrate binding protein
MLAGAAYTDNQMPEGAVKRTAGEAVCKADIMAKTGGSGIPPFRTPFATHATQSNVVSSAPPAPIGSNRALINRLTVQHALPTIYHDRDFTTEGGLMSYGTVTRDLIRRSASYIDRILRGAKPSDLPVEFPTKFELVVNLKTAKAMGLTIPEGFLLRADELIE